jgi:ABC-type branched-subunit amino acid transport system substrate-binding protein
MKTKRETKVYERNRMLVGALALAIFAASPMAASAQQGVTANEILLGEIAPLSGAAAVGSLGLSAGNKLAIAEANAAGGINGRKLRLISEDDGYVVARTVQSARKLLTGDKVFGLVSTSGSASSAAILPMLKESGIPAINVLSFPDSLHTPVVPNIFVAGATHQDTTDQLLQQMNKRFPGKKWAIVLPEDELGHLMQEGVDRAAKELKLNIVYNAKYRRGQKDFSAEILAVQNAGAEILLAGGIVTENIAMVKELDRIGSKIPVGLSWIGRNSSVNLQPMGAAVANVYMIDYVVPDESPEGKTFMELARKLLPEDEFKRVNRFTMVGYAGTRLMLEAMRRCGTDLTWACTVKELDATKDFKTAVIGAVTFSPASHFSKLPLILMKANPKSFNFEPLN